MKIELRRLDNAYHLEAKNELGRTIETDANPEVGGGDKAFRPMQLLLAALGSCSTIDILMILNKQRQDLQDIRIRVEGEREAQGEVSLFNKIHVHYTFIGKVDANKAERAIALSMEKYCSVAKTLEPTATLTTSYEIIAA